MAVSVVGFDIGSLTSYVAVARGGGIETVANEYSDRNTPYVKVFHNYFPKANSCDEELELYPEQLMAMQLAKLKGITDAALGSKVVDVVINVPTYYTDTERRALLDSSRIAGLNCVKLVNDLTASTSMGSANSLSLVATAYGLYHTDLPALDKPSKNVVFVSVGYTSTQIAICAFNAGKVKVLSTACDSRLGGRDFDNVIFNKFAEEFATKYKMKVSFSFFSLLKVSDNRKATVRLLQECDKIKKAMSANSQELPVHIECLIDERDLNCRIKRSEFEELSSELLSRFEGVLNRCLSVSKLGVEELHSVELVGGSSRIPALKNLVTALFYQDGRTTLNADEAVVRGCALQAAICSPAYKVREFAVTEACPYGIALHWERDDCGDQGTAAPAETEGEVTIEGKDTSVEVFPFLHGIPSSRRLFFNRRGPFTLEARYTHPSELPNENIILGAFHIENTAKSADMIKIRVKVRINSHGIFSLSQAEFAEEYEKEVEVDDPEEVPSASNLKSGLSTTTPMDTNVPGNGDASMDATSPANGSDEQSQASAIPTAKEIKVKKKIIKKKAIRYRDLPVEASIMQFSTQELNNFCEIEGKLYEQDELERKRANAKNSVEEYVYEMRNKLNDQLSAFANPVETETLMLSLNETEDWLYGDGEDVNRQDYENQLNAMKKLGDPINFRASEYQNRAASVQQFQQALVHFRKVLDSLEKGENTYDHLTEDQLNQLRTTLIQYDKWLCDQLHLQNAKQTFEDPVLRSADIESQQRAMEAICVPIVNTPKPVSPPPPAPTEQQENSNTTTTTTTTEKTPNSNDQRSNCPINTGVNGGSKGGKKGAKANTGADKAENMDID